MTVDGGRPVSGNCGERERWIESSGARVTSFGCFFRSACGARTCSGALVGPDVLGLPFVNKMALDYRNVRGVYMGGTTCTQLITGAGYCIGDLPMDDMVGLAYWGAVLLGSCWVCWFSWYMPFAESGFTFRCSDGFRDPPPHLAGSALGW